MDWLQTRNIFFLKEFISSLVSEKALLLTIEIILLVLFLKFIQFNVVQKAKINAKINFYIQ